MREYRVKLKFIYSDVVYVEAKDKRHAIQKALFDSEEVYESLYSAEVTEDATNES